MEDARLDSYAEADQAAIGTTMRRYENNHIVVCKTENKEKNFLLPSAFT